MNDCLHEDNEADARYLTWLAEMARQSAGLAELWIDSRGDRVVFALRVKGEED